MHFLDLLWIICWLFLGFLLFTRIEKSFFITIVVCYLIFFPMWKKVTLVFADTKIPWPVFWFTIINIIIFILILIFILLKIGNKLQKTGQLSEKFSLIWLNWKEILSIIPFSEEKFRKFLDFLLKHIKTDLKKWCFYLAIILPKCIVLSALFWDIHIGKELYYCPRLSFLLILPVLCRMLLVIIEFYIEKIIKEISEFLEFIPAEVTKEKNLKYIEILGPGNYMALTMKLKKNWSCKFSQEEYDQLVNDFIYYNSCKNKCDNLKNFVNDKLTYFLLITLLIQICFQLNIIILYT